MRSESREFANVEQLTTIDWVLIREGRMIHRFLLCVFLFALVASAYPAELNAELNYDRTGENWDSSYGAEEGGGGSSSTSGRRIASGGRIPL